MSRFSCPYCTASYTIKPELIGKRVKCAKCEKSFTLIIDQQPNDPMPHAKLAESVTTPEPASSIASSAFRQGAIPFSVPTRTAMAGIVIGCLFVAFGVWWFNRLSRSPLKTAQGSPAAVIDNEADPAVPKVRQKPIKAEPNQPEPKKETHKRPNVSRNLDRTEGQIQAAMRFSFEGVTFATSVAELKKLHPEVDEEDDDIDSDMQKQREANRKVNIEKYMADSKAANWLSLTYLDGKLCEMNILYKSKKRQQAGGNELLIERLVSKFGEPDSDSIGISKKPSFTSFKWTLDNANRLVEFSGLNDASRITVKDISLFSKMVELKKNAIDTGFDK